MGMHYSKPSESDTGAGLVVMGQQQQRTGKMPKDVVPLPLRNGPRDTQLDVHNDISDNSNSNG